SNRRSAGAALSAALLSLLPIIGLGSQLLIARSVPAIHNISTDVIDPPEFVRVRELRTPEHNPLAYDPAKLADVQQAAYPEVQTLLSSMSKFEAHQRSLAIAEALGWEIVNEDPVAGIIEATETTSLWEFKDDIVIRIREQDNQVAVDLRSVSRVGQSDLGANAKRIEKFLGAFTK
ncbi:MAG: DUF1499 domain-containing protein, partial [Gammaproteobacteria bacterium]|nr:DUF1499 domain-containing protein [Gammaproteobacteria bacterium]